MIAAFQALSSVWIAKVKLIEQTEIEKQAYFSSERFFELIKKWGTLDYEEYWNRYSYDTTYLSWSFSVNSWFWNFWNNWVVTSPIYGGRTYNCISNAGLMWTWWCLVTNNTTFDSSSYNHNRTWQPERYWQYELQFIDRNSDNDTDWYPGNCTWSDSIERLWRLWDEDCDGSIIWDDDDLFLGIGPNAYNNVTIGNKVWELYLISNDGKERTYFRWRVETFTWWFVPTWAICDFIDPENPIWEACNGTIEMLKLTGEDYGFDHDSWTIEWDGSQWDGIIDTWFIHPDYASWVNDIVAGSDTNNYWQPIFPSSINIKNFEIYAYPKKDLNVSWRDSDPSILIAPYIQLKYTIEPSLKVKAKIRWKSPSVDIATTISLSSLDIK